MLNQNKRPALPFLFTLSAKDLPSLEVLLEIYAESMEPPPPLETLGRMAVTSCVGQTHLPYRAALVLEDAASFREQVRAGTYLRCSTDFDVLPQLCFLFTGQGSHYRGMGRGLYNTAPVFRESFQLCASVVDEITGGGSPSIADLFAEEAEAEEATPSSSKRRSLPLSTAWPCFG